MSKQTPLPSTTPLRFGYDVPKGGEAQTSSNKTFNLEIVTSINQLAPSHHPERSDRFLGAQTKEGRSRHLPRLVDAGEHAVGDGGLGPSMSLIPGLTTIPDRWIALDHSEFLRKRQNWSQKCRMILKCFRIS